MWIERTGARRGCQAAMNPEPSPQNGADSQESLDEIRLLAERLRVTERLRQVDATIRLVYAGDLNALVQAPLTLRAS